MAVSLKNLTTTRELAEELGVSPQRICQLAKAAGVDGVTVGTAKLYALAEAWRIRNVPRRSYEKSPK